MTISYKEEYRSAGQLSGIFLGILRHLFWTVRYIFLGLSGNFFGISCLFLGYKKEPRGGNGGGFKVFKGVFVLSNVNMCYRRQHCDNENHPFNFPSTTVSSARIVITNYMTAGATANIWKTANI